MLSTADLNVPDRDAGACGLHAAPLPASPNQASARLDMPATVTMGPVPDEVSGWVLVSQPKAGGQYANSLWIPRTDGSTALSSEYVSSALDSIAAGLFRTAVASSGGGQDDSQEASAGWPWLSGDEPASVLPGPGPASLKPVDQALDQASETLGAPTIAAESRSRPVGGVNPTDAIDACFSGEHDGRLPVRTPAQAFWPATEAPAAADLSVAWAGLLAVLLSAEVPVGQTDRRPLRVTRKP